MGADRTSNDANVQASSNGGHRCPALFLPWKPVKVTTADCNAFRYDGRGVTGTPRSGVVAMGAMIAPLQLCRETTGGCL